MKKQAFRNYNITDADLIEQAKTVHGNLCEYIDTFTAFDSSINGGTTEQIAILTKQAENNLPDHVIADRQVQLTDIVKGKMKECRDHFQLLSYFIKKAFPESASIRNEFGENNYGKVRNSQSKMILFMQELNSVAVKYQQELTDTGAKQDYIDKISQLHNDLNQANEDQELYIGKRPVLTEERVKILNDLWKVLIQISRASKIIFASEPAKMKLFLFPTRPVKHKDDTQHISAGEILATIDEGIEPDTYLKIENTGTSDLVFYVADAKLEEAPENALLLNPEKFQIVLSKDISNQTYGKLIAYNIGEEEGVFTVRLME